MAHELPESFRQGYQVIAAGRVVEKQSSDASATRTAQHTLSTWRQ